LSQQVLTTDDVSGLNRAALSAVRALAGTRYRPVVTVSGPRSLAASSRWCTRAVPVPSGGKPGYAEALRAHVRDTDYAAVLPASDVALVALRDPSAVLVDKQQLEERVAEAGLRGLPGEVFDSLGELHRAADRLGYPAVVKSVLKSGLGNLQAVKVSGPDDVRAIGEAPGPLLVQPFIPGHLRAVSGVSWGGRLLAVCHQEYVRTWPPRAGVAAAASTVDGDTAIGRKTEDALTRLLVEHNGVFQVQLLGEHVLDVNPRVYGSMALAVAAGANLPLLACDAASGRFPADVVRARPGARYRWLEGDLRNLADGLRRREVGPRQAVTRLVPRRGTAQSVESLRDPGPSWTRLRRVASGRQGSPP